MHETLRLSAMLQSPQLKTSEVEKNLAWEAQQAVKQQQSNAEAANSLLSSIGGGNTQGVPAGLGSCRLQVSNLHRNLEDVDLKDAFEPFGFLEMIQVRGCSGEQFMYGSMGRNMALVRWGHIMIIAAKV